MHKDIVEVKWLKEHYLESKLVIIDASPKAMVTKPDYNPPNQAIPGSLPINIKQDFADASSQWPNTTPSKEAFEKTCQQLGITNKDHIIIYDSLGIYTSPRIWWLFKVMGHEQVSVLNGGLPAWIEAGLKTEEVKQYEHKTKSKYIASYDQSLRIDYHQICQNITLEKFQVIDARSSGRFTGIEAEPRKSLMSGSISNSKNIHYKQVLDQGKFKPASQLIKLFSGHFSREEEVVYSCGSGMTACIVLLAAYVSYNKSLSVFDGSWTEYATRQGLLK